MNLKFELGHVKSQYNRGVLNHSKEQIPFHNDILDAILTFITYANV